MRKHIAFGHSEKEFKPHIRHIEPVLTECDLDWKSHLRWIPEPRYSDAPFPHIKDIKFPNEMKLMRSFPQANMASQSEWSFYPNFGQPKTYHVGKRCFMDGMSHTRNMRCISENSLESFIGRKKKVTDKVSSADRARPFLVPEYSPGFYKYGSTSQKTTYGFLVTCDSFHPKPLPKDLRTSHADENKAWEKENDILEVERLNTWRPATDIYARTVLQDPL